MKRFLAILLTLTLLVSLAAPVDAFAASKKKSSKKVVYILTIDNDGVRVRTDPSGGKDGKDENVLGSLKKGTKVFYLGTTGAYYRICSEYGPRGYIYKGYASYYGAVALNSIYECDGATKMYKSASTRSKRVTTLRDGQYVVVYAASGKWAYVHTISGKKGYVPVSKLQKP